MKDLKDNREKKLAGRGYLTGAVITFSTAIALFIFTQNVVIAISSSVPLGMTIGILLEQKNQKDGGITSKKTKSMLAGLVILGILVFISVFFLV